MTDLDLTAIRARVRRLNDLGYGYPSAREMYADLADAAASVPALLAEIDRLHQLLSGAPT